MNSEAPLSSTPAPPAVQQRHRDVRNYLCDRLRTTVREALDEVVNDGGLGDERAHPFTAVFVIRLDSIWRERYGIGTTLDLRVYDGQPEMADVHEYCLRAHRQPAYQGESTVTVDDLVDQAGLDPDKPDEVDLAHFIMTQPSPGARYDAMIAVLSELLESIEGRR